MKPRAAALAASSRVGFMSSADMLSETSKASITVPTTLGKLTSVCGLAIARIRIVSAARKMIAGRLPRTGLVAAEFGPAPSCKRERLPYWDTSCRRRCCMLTYTIASSGTNNSITSMKGHIKVIALSFPLLLP